MKLLTLILVFLLICSSVLADRLAVTPGESADDGFETEGGENSVNIDYTYIEFVWDYDRTYGAIRFPNVTISQGATIDSSYMKIWSYSSTHVDAYDTIACEDVDDASVITTTPYDISDRWDDATTARVLWDQYIAEAVAYTRIDCEFKTLVQEVVNRPGWESGNAIMFLLRNTTDSDFEIYTWDHTGTETVESLIVYYTVEAEGQKRILWRK